MKILIAEDDLISRNILGGFLRRMGHQVEAFTDGRAALDRMQEADAPDIAILDRMMPKLSGLEVCKHLRAQPSTIRPYLIVLSNCGEKYDVADGLDAGADDYLPKPFNAVELLARLRVAERAVEYQHQWQAKILDLQSLLQRYHLRGEMLAPARSPIARSVEDAAQSIPSFSETQSPALILPFGQSDIDQLVTDTMVEFRLGSPEVSTVAPRTTGRENAFVAWSSLLLRREGIWIDLVLEADSSSLQVIHEKTLNRRAAAEGALCELQAEILSIITSSLRSHLAARSCEVLLPFLPCAIRTDGLLKPPPLPVGRTIRSFAVVNAELRLSLIPRWQAIRQKTLGQLRPYDTLAQPFRSPALRNISMLNEGVVLTERFIEKLSNIAQNEAMELVLPVFSPSPLALFFTSRSPDRVVLADL